MLAYLEECSISLRLYFQYLAVGIGRGSTAKKGISYLKETIYKIELRIKTKC